MCQELFSRTESSFPVLGSDFIIFHPAESSSTLTKSDFQVPVQSNFGTNIMCDTVFSDECTCHTKKKVKDILMSNISGNHKCTFK